MKIAIFDAHAFERPYFLRANQDLGYELVFFETRLTEQSAPLTAGFDVACSFANDRISREAVKTLKAGGVRLVALRSAGFNQVDLTAARDFHLPVVRVPEYSPYAVAEHAVGLILALNRKISRAHNRVREWNFSLDGLVGFDLHGKTVGIIGAGRIGSVMCRIMTGFGCRVFVYDRAPNPELISRVGVEYVDLQRLFRESLILSLHLPLTPETQHIIDEKAIADMQPGVMLINTGRGALIDSRALLQALKAGKIGFAGLDVYEEEAGIFFEDLSNQMLQDDILARLLTFPNVLVTAHQGFLTQEALENIATTTLQNVREFAAGSPLTNEVRLAEVIRPAT